MNRHPILAYLDEVYEVMSEAGYPELQIEVVCDLLEDQLRAHVPDPTPLHEIDAALSQAILDRMPPSASFAQDPIPTKVESSTRLDQPDALEPERAGSERAWLGWLSLGACVSTLAMSVLVGILDAWLEADLSELGGSTLILGFGLSIGAGIASRDTPQGRMALYTSAGILTLCLAIVLLE